MFFIGLFGILLLVFSSSFTFPNQPIGSHNIRIVKRAADIPDSPPDPNAVLLAATVVFLPVLPCNSSVRQVHYGETLMIESPNFGSITNSENSQVTIEKGADCFWAFWAEDCDMKMSCPLFKLDEFFCANYMEVSSNSSADPQKYCGSQGPQEIPVQRYVDIRYATSKTEQTEQSWQGSSFQCHVSCPYQQIIFDDNTGASPRKS